MPSQRRIRDVEGGPSRFCGALRSLSLLDTSRAVRSVGAAFEGVPRRGLARGSRRQSHASIVLLPSGISGAISRERKLNAPCPLRRHPRWVSPREGSRSRYRRRIYNFPMMSEWHYLHIISRRADTKSTRNIRNVSRVYPGVCTHRDRVKAHSTRSTPECRPPIRFAGGSSQYTLSTFQVYNKNSTSTLPSALTPTQAPILPLPFPLLLYSPL